MIVQGDYLKVFIDFEPFYQKPPLFFWFQVAAMKMFGISDYAARLPNAIGGIITLVVLFHIGKRLYNERFGNIWALCYLGSVLPFLYFKSGIIDPYFNLFIFLGLYHTILFYWKKEGFNYPLRFSKWWYLCWAGIFIGLGILTKGPVAYLLAALCAFVYWFYQRFRFYISVPAALLLTLIALLLPGAWLLAETWLNGPDFVRAFINYNIELATTESAGHGGFPGYHFIVNLLGCFPASVFALRAFAKLPPAQEDYQNDFRIWMKFLFWVVIILFSIVESKIVHYSSLCYFPITFLAALVIYKISKKQIDLKKWMKGLLIGIAAIYVLVIGLMPIIGLKAEQIKGLIDDPFAQANLEAAVHWTGWEVLPAILLIFTVVYFLRLYKKGDRLTSFFYLFGLNAIFILLTLVFFIKRIEGYSQRANIEFFKSLEGEDAYIYTYGYKSYAHLYYSKKTPEINQEIRGWDDEKRQKWLLEGKIDKPIYFSVRVQKADRLEKYPMFERIGEKNGFVFFKRAPKVRNQEE